MQPVESSGGIDTRPQQAEAVVNAPFSSGAQLLINMAEEGQWVELAPPTPVPAGEYDAYLFYGMSWDYGVFQWSIGANQDAGLTDGYSERLGMGSVGPLRATVGAESVTLRVQVIRSNDRSAGRKAGIDALVLAPVWEGRR